jgi:uncharacterized Tic20 family protein
MPSSAAMTAPQTSADPLRFVRYLDVVLVVLAAPFVIALGAPALGFAVGVAAWIVQRAIATAVDARAKAMPDFRRGVALGLASSLGRAWGTGLAILLVGVLAEREDGLTAGITVLAAFTVYFALALVLRPLERKAR